MSEPTKAIQKWADPAMVAAEPVDAAAGPRVYLLSMTPDPLGTIAATCNIYTGKVIRRLSQVDDDQRRYYLDQVLQTRLRAPFEFVKFHFLIEGVTRAFTHQMVRQRTAVYAQESLRFAVKGAEGDLIPVAVPPSVAGLPDDSDTRTVWDMAVKDADLAYRVLIAQGVPAEDARGLLPHATLTRLHYSTDLRALLDHAGNRLCTQAQFEWRLVFSRIAEAIRNYRDPRFVAQSSNERWQQYALADLFRPVCYATGKCEFNSDMDRPCSIRDRVTANHKLGRDPEEWGRRLHQKDGSGDVAVHEIYPEEWLLDPTAARRG